MCQSPAKKKLPFAPHSISTPEHHFGKALLPLWPRASTQASLFCGRLVFFDQSGGKLKRWFHYLSSVMK